MVAYGYPNLQTTAEDDDNPVAELVEDYDMSDPERSKIKPLKSARDRCALFDRLASKDV